MSWKRPGVELAKPIGGWKRIRVPLLAAWISLIASGCALTPAGPPFLPTFPAVPEFVMRPLPLTSDGREYVIVAQPDWLTLGGYILELERQLIGACLALGGSAARCHVEDAQ